MGDAAFGVLPLGWITVSYDPPPDAPEGGIRAKQHADLCSWTCAAAFTAHRTGARAQM